MKIKESLKSVKAFLSPAAFEARARQRERSELATEYCELSESLVMIEGRMIFIERRLETLARKESAANGPTPSPYGTHRAMCPELNMPAKRFDETGEYWRFPRTMRDAFGPGHGLELPKDPPCIWCAAIVIVLFVVAFSGCIYYGLKAFNVI